MRAGGGRDRRGQRRAAGRVGGREHGLGPARRLRRPALRPPRRADRVHGLGRRRAGGAAGRPPGAVRRSRRRWSGWSRSAPREVELGSYVRVPHHPALRPADGLVVSVCPVDRPGAPGGRRRALISTWGDGDGWALALDADGRPRFEVGAGGELEAIAGEIPVEPGCWARLEAALDPRAATDLADPLAPRGSAARGDRGALAPLRAPGSRAGRGRAADRGGAAGGDRRRPPRRQARRARGALRTGRRARGRELVAGRGPQPAGGRLGAAGPARPLRQRPAARGHRRVVARRRPRLAPGARAVRGDALPRRRRRRPRLAADLCGRAAGLAASPGSTRSSSRPAA